MLQKVQGKCTLWKKKKICVDVITALQQNKHWLKCSQVLKYLYILMAEITSTGSLCKYLQQCRPGQSPDSRDQCGSSR